MKFLGDLASITGDVYRVGLIHNMPFDPINGLNQTEEELNTTGVLVEDVPEPEPIEGKRTTGIFVNKATREVWWEYEDIPVTPEEQQKADLDFLASMIGVEL